MNTSSKMAMSRKSWVSATCRHAARDRRRSSSSAAGAASAGGGGGPWLRAGKVATSAFLQRARCSSNDSREGRPFLSEYEINEHTRELVREADPAGYVCTTLFKPRELRPELFSLRAFDLELKAIKESARGNVMPGMVRFRWWRDVLDIIYGTSTGTCPSHPSALALQNTIARHGITRRWLERILDARERDFEDTGFASLAEMERFAEHTMSSLLYMSLELAQIDDEAALHAASHVGKAVGISKLLASIGFHSSTKTSVLPRDLSAQHKLTRSVVCNGPQDPDQQTSLSDVVYEVACLANQHLEDGQRIAAGLSTEAFRCLLPGVYAAFYLEGLQRHHFDAFNEKLRPAGLPFHWRVGKACLSKAF